MPIGRAPPCPAASHLYPVIVKRILLACFLLVFGVACSEDAASYESASALVAALEEEDIRCENLEIDDEVSGDAPPEAGNIDSLLAERGVCEVDGDALVVSMFDNASDKDNWVAVGQLVGPVAVGENWAVSSDAAALVARVADALGAEVPEP